MWDACGLGEGGAPAMITVHFGPLGVRPRDLPSKDRVGCCSCCPRQWVRQPGDIGGAAVAVIAPGLQQFATLLDEAIVAIGAMDSVSVFVVKVQLDGDISEAAGGVGPIGEAFTEAMNVDVVVWEAGA
jgi:hypothetical protein